MIIRGAARDFLDAALKLLGSHGQRQPKNLQGFLVLGQRPKRRLGFGNILNVDGGDGKVGGDGAVGGVGRDVVGSRSVGFITPGDHGAAGGRECSKAKNRVMWRRKERLRGGTFFL